MNLDEARRLFAGLLDMTPLDLPSPKPTLPGPVIGAKLISPVHLEGYDRGYQSLVQDEYEAAFSISSCRAVESFWIFKRRIRTYTKPLHYDRMTGQPYRCEECEHWWAERPHPEDEVLTESECPVALESPNA